MWKSFKVYIAAFGKWGFVVAAIIVGDIVGITQSFFTNCAIPTWAWWTILVVVLAIAPFFAFHKLREHTEELEKKINVLNNREAIKASLDRFIGEGNHILSIITTESIAAIDRYDFQMDEWATNVRNLLKPFAYENDWMSNSGLVNEESENQGDDIKNRLAISRNYMRNRIIRLREIKTRLGD